MIATPDQSDAALLGEFAANRSPEAFSTLFARHSAWVYSAALRMVRDPHLAEDVAQAVFLVLAQKAAKLQAVPLHRWLFKVTRYASANALRARARREKHERRAAMSNREIHQPDPDQLWQEIAPALDDSLSRLRTRDRDAIILRFYQQKEFAEVAAALGVSEGAAKIRIIRAVEKLRDILRRRGLKIPAADLGAALLAHATHPAPASVATGCASASASAQAAAIAKGVSTMMTLAKIKFAAAIILIFAIPVGAGAIFLVDSAQAPAPVASQPAVEEPVSQAPSAPAAAIDTYGLDPRVAPFVTSRSDIIIEIDLTRIDLDAVAADLRAELDQSSFDPATIARISPEIQEALTIGKQWITGFAQAGGTKVFVIARTDQLLVPGLPGTSLSLSKPTIVFPLDSEDAAQNLAQFMTFSNDVKAVDNAVVINPPTSAADAGPGARPALAAGLSASPDAPIRIAVNPAKLSQIMPELQANVDLPTTGESKDWDDAESFSVNVILPPAATPGYVMIAHFKDAATAQNADATEIQANQRMLRSPAKTPLAKVTLKWLATAKFEVRGSDVIQTRSLRAYWDLVLTAAYIGLSNAGHAQPSAH